MKHPVKKTIALLIAACFLLGNTVVFAADVGPIDIPAIDSEMPMGVSVHVNGPQPDGSPGITTVRGDETMYYPQGSPNGQQQGGPSGQQGGPSSQQGGPSSQQGGPSSQQGGPSSQQQGGPSSQQQGGPSSQQQGGPSSQQQGGPSGTTGGPSGPQAVSNEKIDSITVNVESINNECDPDIYADHQRAGTPKDEMYPVSSGLYVFNAGAKEVNVNVEQGITNTGNDLEQTFGVETHNWCDGNTNIQIKGDVNTVATGDNDAIGIGGDATDGKLSISANNVITKGEATATGVELRAGDSMAGKSGIVEANVNDISVSAKESVAGLSVQVSDGTANITTGNITVDTTGQSTPESMGSAGVRIMVFDPAGEAKEKIVNVTSKDIIATGENTIGIEIFDDPMQPENEEAVAQISVISDGTVSGDTVAIRVHSGDREDASYINLTLWSVKDNKDGQIVNVNGSLEPEAKEAAAAIEARINYIIKLADSWKNNIGITTAKGNTVTIAGQTYNTANENETVTINVKTLADGQALDGIYYTDGDENTFTAVNNLTRNADGSYSIKMLRGGSMMLSLKVHTHVAGAAVQENVTDTGYDEVVYCSICGAELGRTHVTIDQPAPAPVVQETPVAVPAVVERFVAVDENTEVHGVKAADRLPIEEAFAILGEHLDDEQAVVTIENMDQILDATEMTQFESLKASDRLMVLLSVISNSDVLQATLGNMSADAKALADEITTRISNMTDAEKAAFDQLIRSMFEVRKVTVDGQEYDGISIELTITKNGEETRERYSFYNDQNTWKLYQIEQLQTVVA